MVGLPVFLANPNLMESVRHFCDRYAAFDVNLVAFGAGPRLIDRALDRR